MRNVWVVTGAAGFIGHHIVIKLLKMGEKVRGIDSFITSDRLRLKVIANAVGDEVFNSNFQFHEADCRYELDWVIDNTVKYVLHQAALGSVPRSIESPRATFQNNVYGFHNVLVAAKESGVERVVYASSSSVYGDEPSPIKYEHILGSPKSPYAASKRMNEVYAESFSNAFGMEIIGLRYFNVFGPGQSSKGPYAAVIPKWIQAFLSDEQIEIYGNGDNRRDFCPVENVVQANILAAKSERVSKGVFNIGCGDSMSMITLFETMRDEFAKKYPEIRSKEPIFRDSRPGDVANSEASLMRASKHLNYMPLIGAKEALRSLCGDA